MREMDPSDPTTLYSEGPVAAEPPDDDKPDASPLRDSGGPPQALTTPTG